MERPTKVKIDRLTARIEVEKTKLAKLYARRKELKQSLRPPKRLSAEEKQAEIYALAKQGLSVLQIASKFELSPATASDHLRRALWDEGHKRNGGRPVLGAEIDAAYIAESIKECYHMQQANAELAQGLRPRTLCIRRQCECEGHFWAGQK